MIRAVLTLLLLVPVVSAHAPAFNEAGSSPETAFEISDPTKSWVFYDSLAQSEQHWFQFQLLEGEQLSTSLNLPAGEKGRPVLWIMSTSFEGQGPASTPEGWGAVQVPPRDELSVEPFSPLAMRSTAQWREPAPVSGTYYIMIEGAGSYSLGLGARESFTPQEWLTIPIDRIAIQEWGGVPWIFAVLGEAIGLGAAIAISRRREMALRPSVGLAGVGLIGGTALTTSLLAAIAVSQAGLSFAAIIPAVFALLSAGIAYGAYQGVLRGTRWWSGLLWAAAALVVWAGLLVGPAVLSGWAIWQGLSNNQH